jgi:p24 family protein alpha
MAIAIGFAQRISVALAALTLTLMFVGVQPLYFHIRETERKCFIEEVPDETLVVGKYKVQIFDRNTNDYMPTTQGIGMHVEVRDPEQKVILSKLYSAEGRFSFTTHMPGEHVICLYSNSSAWFGGGNLRVHLDIEVGEHAVDYNELAGKEKLTELQLRVRQLLDQVEQISKEQNYQRVSLPSHFAFSLFLLLNRSY